MAVVDYSTTPSLNTSISGINIGEGCAPANINNAIRQMMADIKGYTSGQIPFEAGDGIAATTVRAAIIEARSDAIAAIPGAATPTTSGLMSAADKTKLNEVAAGAGVTAPIATEAQAQAGANDTATMTPLRVEQHMLANAIGWGQDWSNPTRAGGETYTNSTGRPILVCVNNEANIARYFRVRKNSSSPWVNVARTAGFGQGGSWSVVVPAGYDYMVTEAVPLSAWAELR